MGGPEQGLACAFAALDIAGYVGDVVSGGAATAGVVGLRAAVKGGIKVGEKVIAKEALELLIKKGGRELAEKLGKEGLQELAEKLGKEGLQELAEKMGKEEFEKLAKEAAEKGVKGFEGVLEKGAKEGAEGAAEKEAKDAADLATRRSVDGASEVKVKENGTIEVCPVQRCPSLKDTLGHALETPEVAKHANAAETLAKEGKAAQAVDEGVDALAQARKRDIPRLEPGTKPQVTRGKLVDHELVQAREIVELRGGHLEGAPRRSFPGIDGTLNGVPVTPLKRFEGVSPTGVLRHASKAEDQARNARIAGVEVYIHAEKISSATLIDFASKGPLSQIPSQGTVRAIYVKTADGWVVIPGSH